MAATDNYTEASTSDAQENLTNVYDNFQLSKFLEERKKKISRISPNILAIHKKTDRVLTNQTAKEKEFYTKRGKYYPNITKEQN
jgi:stress response protein YsnF